MTARPQIPKRPLGRTGEEVTIFGLGGEGVLRTHGRTREAIDVIHRALDRGVTYFDSAPAYAGCLDYLGEGLAGRREGILVASKTHDRTRDGSLRLLEETLARLRTNRLDLWQLHDLRTPRDLDAIFGPDGALEALLEAREDGRVRFLGITGHHDPAILSEAMRRFPFDTALVALNAADKHRLSFVEETLPEARKQNLGVIAMKVYAQGALLQSGRLGRLLGKAGLTTEEAFGYSLSLAGVSTAIIGCRTPDEVDENVSLACSFRPFDQPRLQELEQRTARGAEQFAYFKKRQLTGLD